MASPAQIKARKDFVKNYAKKKGSKKGKTKFERKVASSRNKEKGSGFTYREMLRFYQKDFKANSVPELRFKEKMIAKYQRLANVQKA